MAQGSIGHFKFPLKLFASFFCNLASQETFGNRLEEIIEIDDAQQSKNKFIFYWAFIILIQIVQIT